MSAIETIRLGLAECVHHWAQYQPDRVAIDSGVDTITYRRLDREVQQITDFLDGQISEVQQPIGVLAAAPIAFFKSVLGVLRHGGQVVILNPFLTPHVLQAAITDAGCKLVIVDDQPDAGFEAPALSNTRSVGLHGIAQAPLAETVRQRCIRRASWTWGIIYSSGTTGVPKGIVQGDTAMRNELVSWAMELPITRRNGNVYVGRPVFFTGGLVIAASTLFVGGTMIAPIEHSTEFYWAHCARIAIDLAFFIPDQLRALVDAAERGIKGSRGARTILSMGSTVSKTVKAKVIALLGSELIESWANTEGIGTITDPQDVAIRPGSVGRPFLTDEIVILDENGHRAPPGQIGRVAGASGTQMIEFRNRPDLNKAMFVDNYVISEDLGYLDEDGYLYIVGRVVERFLRNGMPVYAVDIEQALLELPEVEQVAVIGLPDADEGNVPVAAVVPRSGVTTSEDALLSAINRTLTAPQQLRMIRFVTGFERNAAGKIIPGAVTAMFMMHARMHDTPPAPLQELPYAREPIQLEWDPAELLRQEYSQPVIPDDQAAFLQFFAQGLKQIGREFERGLELGAGPTLHRAAQLVRWVHRLDLADYQEFSLEQIRRWVSRDPGAHDWSVYLGGARGVLDCEGDGGTVADREALLRARIGELIVADIRRTNPLGHRPPYPLVSACFCLEWATPTMAGWRANLGRATSLVEPGGWMFMLGVHNADGRILQGRRYLCPRIDQADVRSELTAQGFDPDTIHLEVTAGTSVELDDVREIFMVFGRKR